MRPLVEGAIAQRDCKGRTKLKGAKMVTKLSSFDGTALRQSMGGSSSANSVPRAEHSLDSH